MNGASSLPGLPGSIQNRQGRVLAHRSEFRQAEQHATGHVLVVPLMVSQGQ